MKNFKIDPETNKSKLANLLMMTPEEMEKEMQGFNFGNDEITEEISKKCEDISDAFKKAIKSTFTKPHKGHFTDKGVDNGTE